MDAVKIDDSLLEEIEAHSVLVAQRAGQILMEHFSKPLEVEFKGEKKTDPVTTADHRSEEFLKANIGEKFPEHAILSEEGGALNKSDSPFIWVLDPLDGTTNFMNGLPFFAVSVGVLWNYQPVAGSIFVPVSHRASEGVYHARLGKGAYFNDEKIEVANESPGRPLAELPYHFRSQFRLSGESRKEPQEIRNLGSIAVELALTACGVFGYSLFGGPKLWDVAAGVLLVKEAGGLVFTKWRRQRKWLPLEQFPVEKNDDQEELEKLGKWSSPLVVGTPDRAGKLVRDIRNSRSPLFRRSAPRWLRGHKRRK
ncbi:MAG: hypothetical protein CL876_01280 [Dehalococcoidales bacterium]|jgi:myo-inositol-1(or 4)-monophosphatase|nr:hypothetical protein [Dehalococcoidales bacterium]